jgi:hypothetical protein
MGPPGLPDVKGCLHPGNKTGQNADWWVVAKTPFDPPFEWFSYVCSLGWFSGLKLCVQAPLFNLPPFKLPDMDLSIGTYTFYFALDGPDDQPTGPWWGLDSVEVTVQ